MFRCGGMRCTECPLGECEFVSVAVNIFFQKCSYGGPLDSRRRVDIPPRRLADAVHLVGGLADADLRPESGPNHIGDADAAGVAGSADSCRAARQLRVICR